MKAIAKQLSRLEDQFGPADGKPRERFRIVLQPAGLRTPDLEQSTGRRTLWPNGTVSETVELGTSSNGREVADDELEQWISSFPIQVPDGRIHVTPIPPLPEIY